jgi:GNAT superfamily N-acetyltransferase
MFANPHTAALIAEMDKTAPSEHWLDTLNDGTHVLIRPLSAQDRLRLLAFSSIYRRCRCGSAFGRGQSCRRGHHRFAAERLRGSQPRLPRADPQRGPIAGHRHQSLQARRRKRGECAVAVAEAWQRKGLGRLLLGHLIDAARREGLRTLCSTNLSTDYPIHGLYKQQGFTSVYLGRDFDRLVHELEL